MKFLRTFVEVVGWVTLVLFMAGAFGLGDFVYRFGPLAATGEGQKK